MNLTKRRQFISATKIDLGSLVRFGCQQEGLGRVMSFRLTPDELADVVEKIKLIAKSGIEVETFSMGRHKFMLSWDGPEYPVLVGITSTDWKGTGTGTMGATRGRD